MRYRAAGAHAIDLADGRMLAPGETADIDPDDPHHQAAITDGRLIPATTPTPVSPGLPARPRRSAAPAPDPPNALGLPGAGSEEER